jgi:hypothetical protein
MNYAFGEADIYGICDLPDVASATALSLMINSTGALTVNLTPSMTVEDVDSAMTKVTVVPLTRRLSQPTETVQRRRRPPEDSSTPTGSMTPTVCSRVGDADQPTRVRPESRAPQPSKASPHQSATYRRVDRRHR